MTGHARARKEARLAQRGPKRGLGTKLKLSLLFALAEALLVRVVVVARVAVAVAPPVKLACFYFLCRPNSENTRARF